MALQSASLSLRASWAYHRTDVEWGDTCPTLPWAKNYRSIKKRGHAHCVVFQVAELRHQANKVNFPLRSPFLNSIEFCWSKLKAGVAREILTKDDTLTPCIISSAQSVTASVCEGWIKHFSIILSKMSFRGAEAIAFASFLLSVHTYHKTTSYIGIDIDDASLARSTARRFEKPQTQCIKGAAQ